MQNKLDDEAYSSSISSSIWAIFVNSFKWLAQNNSTISEMKEPPYTIPEEFNDTTISNLNHGIINETTSYGGTEGTHLPHLVGIQNQTFTPNTTVALPLSMYPDKYPIFYEPEECRKLNCTSDPLYLCEKPGFAFGLGLFFVLFGTASIIGNCVLPIVVWKRNSMRTRQNYIKVSLSFNDMISGFVLLFSLPNMLWFRSHPESQVIHEIMNAVNSPVAIIAGSSLLISLQGSLFHLMFLSVERFIAIKWPMWNRRRRKSSVAWTLSGIWIITIVGSALPALFPRYFNYLFNYLVFVYTLGYEANTSSKIHGQLHFGLALVFPYVATILLTVLTGAIALKELKRMRRSRNYPKETMKALESSDVKANEQCDMLRGDSIKRYKFLQPELAIVKTVSIMVGSFTLAWSVFFIVYFLSAHKSSGNEGAQQIIYMASFYSGLSNSVANVIIYSVRDCRFRDAVTATFWSREPLQKSNDNFNKRMIGTAL